MPNTVQFHRVLRATPERVYRAFVDPDAMMKWLPPNGFTGKVHEIDPRVGGKYRASFTNFTSGNSHSFGGEYLELVPHELLRWTDKLDGLPGVMTVTVRLKKVSVGTEISIVQEDLPDVIPPDACTLGWQESLDEVTEQPRLTTTLAGAFAVAALLLTAVGIYGVISHAVSLRTPEIGVRMAIGAARTSVVALVLRGGMTWAGGGIVLGLLAACAASRAIAGLLFNTSAADPLTFGVTALALAGVAALACLVPAIRATRIDPVIALRGD